MGRGGTWEAATNIMTCHSFVQTWLPGRLVVKQIFISHYQFTTASFSFYGAKGGSLGWASKRASSWNCRLPPQPLGCIPFLPSSDCDVCVYGLVHRGEVCSRHGFICCPCCWHAGLVPCIKVWWIKSEQIVLVSRKNINKLPFLIDFLGLIIRKSFML
jgi:hypothetical protein